MLAALPRTADGLAFCERSLGQIPQRKARGERPCVIFDIDNTLVDTRYRTLAAAHAFARHWPDAHRLAALTVEQVGYDGRETARNAGLSDAITQRFHRFWDRFFWGAGSFCHDEGIHSTIELARRAHAAGAEVFYLTGRVAALHRTTKAQLLRLGLADVDDAHVLCKPTMETRTTTFKRERTLRLLERPVLWFMSDATSDLAALHDVGVSCVHVDFPVNSKRAPAIDPTPTIRVR